MLELIKGYANSAVNLLFPPHCAACGSPIDSATGACGVCPTCRGRIGQNPRPYEKAAPSFAFTKVYSACLYEGAIKEVIHNFKYGRKVRLALFLSDLMAGFIIENPCVIEGIDIITFVPLLPNRERERQFNQSKVLAGKISGRFGIRLVDMLEKHRKTKYQNELTRNERLANLKGAFRMRKNAAACGMRILLVDDVMTTGSTLDECSRTLLKGGAEEVRCLTLARGA